MKIEIDIQEQLYAIIKSLAMLQCGYGYDYEDIESAIEDVVSVILEDAIYEKMKLVPKMLATAQNFYGYEHLCADNQMEDGSDIDEDEQ